MTSRKQPDFNSPPPAADSADDFSDQSTRLMAADVLTAKRAITRVGVGADDSPPPPAAPVPVAPSFSFGAAPDDPLAPWPPQVVPADPFAAPPADPLAPWPPQVAPLDPFAEAMQNDGTAPAFAPTMAAMPAVPPPIPVSSSAERSVGVPMDHAPPEGSSPLQVGPAAASPENWFRPRAAEANSVPLPQIPTPLREPPSSSPGAPSIPRPAPTPAPPASKGGAGKLVAALVVAVGVGAGVWFGVLNKAPATDEPAPAVEPAQPVAQPAEPKPEAVVEPAPPVQPPMPQMTRGQVRISTDPPDADVWINGEPVPERTPTVVGDLPFAKELVINVKRGKLIGQAKVTLKGDAPFAGVNIKLERR